MNRKGFTLTELLAVIAIIGIISLIAIPNIANISDSVKSENMLNDAKRFISLARSEVNSNYDIRTFNNPTFCTANECTFSIIDLNKNGDFNMDEFEGTRMIVDVDGFGYANGSYVKYKKVGSELKYCINLISEKRFLAKANESSPSCVDEELLVSKDIVHVKQ